MPIMRAVGLIFTPPYMSPIMLSLPSRLKKLFGTHGASAVHEMAAALAAQCQGSITLSPPSDVSDADSFFLHGYLRAQSASIIRNTAAKAGIPPHLKAAVIELTQRIVVARLAETLRRKPHSKRLAA